MKRILSILFMLCFFVLTGECKSFKISFFDEPSFENPVCQLATAEQFRDKDFSFWCDELKVANRPHRKLWECCYILQTLHVADLLQPGNKGLGFGVGTEPLSAEFAKYGCFITATDQDVESAKEQGWVATGQHTLTKKDLNPRNICDPEQFDRLVELRCVDMNNVDPDLYEQYDFTWSSCSLEHLGSLEAGFTFIKNSLNCLKPGGIAVHTTEYNLSSLSETLTEGGTVIYRQSDIVEFLLELVKEGYEVSDLNLYSGSDPLDIHIDVPPYTSDIHLKLQIAKYTCTSIGLIIKKPAQ